MTKEERKEYSQKYYQKNKDAIKQYNKEYYENHKEIKKKQEFFSTSHGKITVPYRYRNKFNNEVDIVFLSSSILVYPHNDLNNDKDNILHLTLTSKGQLKIGRRLFYKYWDYIPEKVRYIEYKKGLLMIPVEEKVDD